MMLQRHAFCRRVLPPVLTRPSFPGLVRLRTFSTAEAATSVTASPKLPTIEVAKAMPTSCSEVSNETLFLLSEQEHGDACFERMIREVMKVDGIQWPEAKIIVDGMQKKALEFGFIDFLPHKVGFTAAAVAGFGSIPMIFNLQCALWFNKKFVTSEVPGDEELETIWEVGSWTWNWMEPALGTASFVLLAMQFMRSQMLNMQVTPYTGWALDRRGRALSASFPRYNREVVKLFAKTAGQRDSF